MYGHRNLQKSSKIYVLLLFYKVKLCKKMIFCKFRFSLISVHLLTQGQLKSETELMTKWREIVKSYLEDLKSET